MNMKKLPVADFFLGALSPAGFSGWFNETAQNPAYTAFLIKAGPGCGKSTFMRCFSEVEAQQAIDTSHIYAERIHCSSDPDSLDGVVLPQAKAMILDATAPHVVDCKYPGADFRVVSLFDALDYVSLLPHKKEIMNLGRANTAYLGQAAELYSFASAILRRNRREAAQYLKETALLQYATRLAVRTMSRQHNEVQGRVSHRLLSAPTPHGLTVYAHSVSELADNIYVLHDKTGAVSDRLLPILAEYAQQNGYDSIVCHCSTDQSRIEHLIIPSLRLAFVTSNSYHTLRYPNEHRIYANRFLRPMPIQCGYKKEQTALLHTLFRQTTKLQCEAKAVHDLLEKYYVDASDFAVIDRHREALQKELYS